jgi:hypothetical protein
MSEYEPHAVASDNATMVTQAQEKVQETAQQASRTAANAVSAQVETRAGQAGSELRSVATALRRSGHSLHADGNESAAKVVDTVVEKLESLAGYLTQADGTRMLHDVERFGRRPRAAAGSSRRGRAAWHTGRPAQRCRPLRRFRPGPHLRRASASRWPAARHWAGDDERERNRASQEAHG